MKNNIILVGMMGAGKSYIGKHLKETYPQMSLIDTDEFIEKSQNMKISDIFKKYGESYFRNLETKVIKELSQNDNQIISLGGGAFENEENREILNENGYTIYLKASAEIIFDRIKSETHRPLLKQGFGVDKIAEILVIRECNYQKAHIIIDTSMQTSYNIISEIMKRIEGYAE